MGAGVAMPEIKTAGPSVGLVEKKEVSFETNIRPEDKVREADGGHERSSTFLAWRLVG